MADGTAEQNHKAIVQAMLAQRLEAVKRRGKITGLTRRERNQDRAEVLKQATEANNG